MKISLILPILLLTLLGLVSPTVYAASYISAQEIRENTNPDALLLRSRAAAVYDLRDDEPVLERNEEEVAPIASLTKLMTAIVVLDGQLDMDEVIEISKQDKDRVRYSRSRLRKGMRFTRRDLLQIALTASENRAALALARTWPGGTEAFVQAMNKKSEQLGLDKTRFVDSAGLGNENVSTAHDLVKLVKAATEYPLIQQYTTQDKGEIQELKRGRNVEFGNTNRLVKRDSWTISLSKTGYTSEAGNCLVMQTEINSRPVIIVLLESWGKLTKYGDSNRIRKWISNAERKLEKRALKRMAAGQ